MITQNELLSLEPALKSASPEGYGLLKAAGLIQLHFTDTARSLGIQPGSDGILSKRDLDRIAEAGRSVPAGLLEKAAVLSSFSENATEWPDQLDAYIARVGPEGYANAKQRGRLEEHIRTVCAQVNKKKLQNPNLDVRRELAAKAQPIGETFNELMGVARNAKEIFPSQYHAMHERFDVASGAERARMADQVVLLFSERPEFGASISKQAYESQYGGTELYLYSIGAQAFGRGCLTDAAGKFEEATKKYAAPHSYRWWANCLRAQNEHSSAMRILVEGMSQHPDDFWIRSAAAGVAFAAGGVAQANAIFDPIVGQYDRLVLDAGRMRDRDAELKEAIASWRMYRDTSNDLYDDAFTTSTWWNYWHHFNTYSRFQHAEGAWDKVVDACIQRAVSAIGHVPPAFVEIGSLCGEIISHVATNFPEMRCFGVDRQELIKHLNDQAYKHPNLTFVAGDAVDLMEKEKEAVKGGMLFHVRTAPFLYPAYLEHLYQKARACGLEYVAFVEANFMSHTHRKFRSFDQMEEVAEIRRPGLIHHNYPRVLREAGFEVIINEMLPPTLLSAGMDQSMFLVAKVAQ